MRSWLHRHMSINVGIVILVGLTLFGYALLANGERTRQNHTALTALCALRHDLDVRIDSSRAFLREHPYGVDGLTAALIRQSLRNSERTREALNVLDCKE